MIKSLGINYLVLPMVIVSDLGLFVGRLLCSATREPHLPHCRAVQRSQHWYPIRTHSSHEGLIIYLEENVHRSNHLDSQILNFCQNFLFFQQSLKFCDSIITAFLTYSDAEVYQRDEHVHQCAATGASGRRDGGRQNSSNEGKTEK